MRDRRLLSGRAKATVQPNARHGRPSTEGVQVAGHPEGVAAVKQGAESMGFGLGVLNAIACVAVLSAVGWWGWSEWRGAQTQLVLLADLTEVEEVLRGLAEWQDECQAVVDAWDDSTRPDLIDPLGPSALAQVERCRAIIRMRPREWAMD